jgi:hypothetical protein
MRFHWDASIQGRIVKGIREIGSFSMRDCFVGASSGIKNCVLYSEELEVYLHAILLIANGVCPVIRRYLAQVDQEAPKVCAGGEIPLLTRTEQNESECTTALVRSANRI